MENKMDSLGGYRSSTHASPSTGNEGPWWRWTHGKSGSISSSSDGVPHSHSGSTSYAASADTAGNTSFNPSSTATWDSVRWQKRATRTGLASSRDETSSMPSGSTTSAAPPHYFAGSTAAFGSSSARCTSSGLRKKPSVSTLRPVSREAPVRKKSVTSPGHRSSVPARETKSSFGSTSHQSASDRRPTSEIKWTSGSNKRKINKKDKKVDVTSVSSTRTSNVGIRSNLAWSESPVEGRKYPRSYDDVDMLETKSSVSVSPTSSASTASSFASVSFGRPDPLVTCARAVLQDCIRQQYIESSNMRKRTLEGHSKSHSAVDSKFFDCISKSSESSGLSCCSSSSDDELSQLSSLELSRQRDDKHDRDSECKMSRQELYRQLMLGEYDLSSSPDFDSFSPSLFEERGLPVEIRYQLPLALGTANETEKECTICQLHYGIGDHIVTLPCQHFFHACCVDKWLWNHTSCPLCRTEVTLDGDSEQFSLKHRFNECSQSDQEAIRRKMRSSSHSAGFRPVVPANVEVDQLQIHLSGISIQEETTESNHVKYLVCPRPQRAQPQ